MQAELFRDLQQRQLLPVSPRQPRHRWRRSTKVIARVAARQKDELAPAIIASGNRRSPSIAKDLRVWLRKLPAVTDWRPEYFEFAFGLPDLEGRDRGAVPNTRSSMAAFGCAGRSISSSSSATALSSESPITRPERIERRWKTVIGGGALLQPVLYSLAVENVLGAPVAIRAAVLLHVCGRLRRSRDSDQRSEPADRHRSAGDHRPRHRAGIPAGGAAGPCLRLVRLPIGLRTGRASPRQEQAVRQAGGSRCAEGEAMTRLADQDARDAIAHALDETLVVEAAAGTGKTTELVTRIVRVLEHQKADNRQHRRGHLHREGGRRVEAALARGARCRAQRSRRRDGKTTGARPGPVGSRERLHQHHPRLLRRAAARAAGRGPDRSALLGPDRTTGGATFRRGLQRLAPGAARGPAGRDPTRAAPFRCGRDSAPPRGRTHRSIVCGARPGISPSGATSPPRGRGRRSIATATSIA